MTFPFPIDPVLRAVNPLVSGKTQQYILEQDFTYNSAAFGSITAPAGMATDFASIPRAAWTWLSPEDPGVLFPSLVHDFLYSVSGQLPLRRLTRAECDSVLREAMLACGARSTQASVVYNAVRLFGGGHWKSP